MAAPIKCDSECDADATFIIQNLDRGEVVAWCDEHMPGFCLAIVTGFYDPQELATQLLAASGEQPSNGGQEAPSRPRRKRRPEPAPKPEQAKPEAAQEEETTAADGG